MTPLNLVKLDRRQQSHAVLLSMVMSVIITSRCCTPVVAQQVGATLPGSIIALSNALEQQSLIDDLLASSDIPLVHNKNPLEQLVGQFGDALRQDSSSLMPPQFAATESNCSRQFAHLIEALVGIRSDPEVWQFIDATGKLPSGITTGALTWPGLFSQCLNISSHYTNTEAGSGYGDEELLKGQYCYLSVGSGSGPIDNQNPLSGSSTGTVLNVGLCLPDTCSENATATFIENVLSVAGLTKSGINVRGVVCHQTGRKSLDTGAVVVIVILSILGAAIVAGTAYEALMLSRRPMAPAAVESAGNLERSGADPSYSTIPTTLGVTEYTPLLDGQTEPATVIHKSTPSVGVRLLLCFSLITNGSKLLSTKAPSGKNLPSIHGIRFFSMTWVILGHSLVMLIGNLKNPLKIFADFFMRYNFMPVVTASHAVDTFFLLSGTLVSFLLLCKMNEKSGPKGINWLLFYFHRFWRLTPPYMLVLAVYTTLYHYMGDGPTYAQTANTLCTKYWWQNLLYINNFYSLSNTCMDWTWYLANDMQFFIITPLIVIALYKWMVIGYALILALILVNLITVGVLTRQNGYPPDISSLNQLNITAGTETLFDYLNYVYVRPYTRVGVYMVGVALGHILYKTDLKPKLHWIVDLVGWIVAFVCCYEVTYGYYGASSGHVIISPAVSAFYASVHRVVWSIGVAYVIFACSTGYGGPINTFLSWRAFVPLSRLTYMAYLIHPAVLQYMSQTMEYTAAFNSMFLISHFLATVAIAYGLAFVASLAFEAPMMALEKVVLPQK